MEGEGRGRKPERQHRDAAAAKPEGERGWGRRWARSQGPRAHTGSESGTGGESGPVCRSLRAGRRQRAAPSREVTGATILVSSSAVGKTASQAGRGRAGRGAALTHEGKMHEAGAEDTPLKRENSVDDEKPTRQGQTGADASRPLASAIPFGLRPWEQTLRGESAATRASHHGTSHPKGGSAFNTCQWSPDGGGDTRGPWQLPQHPGRTLPATPGSASAEALASSKEVGGAGWRHRDGARGGQQAASRVPSPNPWAPWAVAAKPSGEAPLAPYPRATAALGELGGGALGDRDKVAGRMPAHGAPRLQHCRGRAGTAGGATLRPPPGGNSRNEVLNQGRG